VSFTPEVPRFGTFRSRVVPRSARATKLRWVGAFAALVVLVLILPGLTDFGAGVHGSAPVLPGANLGENSDPPTTSLRSTALPSCSESVEVTSSVCIESTPFSSDANWTNLTPLLGVTPPPRYYSAEAYDANASAQYLLMFGGRNLNSALGDTWSFANDSWTSRAPFILSPLNSPSPRYGASMAYDPALGGVLLFGGRSTTTPFNDTWLFRNGTWSQLNASTGPSPRTYAAMFYLASPVNALVLFGGYSSTSSLNDTWEFNASTGWRNVTAFDGPPPTSRYGAGVAVNTSSETALLFGGYTQTSGAGAFLNDTWTFNASGWSRQATLFAPGPRSDPQMAFDPLTGSVLLFGGIAPIGNRWGDLWSYGGGQWTQLSSTENSTLPARAGGVFAALPSANFPGSSLVMFGGFEDALSIDNSTWLYGNPLPLGLPNPSPSLPAFDAGSQVRLSAQAIGGTPPYTYRWAVSPSSVAGCAIQDSSSVTCLPTGNSSRSTVFSVTVSVNDSGAATATSGVTQFTVNPAPAITGLVVNPSTVSVGGSATITVTTTGGTGSLRYQFTGLPASCSSADSAKFTCVPGSAGTYSISLTVTDAVGTTATTTIPRILTVTSAAGPSPGTSVWLIVGAIAAVAVVVAIVGILYYRRKNRPPPPPAPDPSPVTSGPKVPP
jgi:Galactose oxidase, central domain